MTSPAELQAIREQALHIDCLAANEHDHGEDAREKLYRDIAKSLRSIEAQSDEVRRLRDALEIVRPHVDLGQARLNGSYCAAKIDEHTFCGRGRNWPGHTSDAREWPEHEFVDGSALVAALGSQP